MKQENDRQINERVARLEVGLTNVCDSIVEIKTNHLKHLNDSVEKLDERFDILDKKVESMGVKLGIVFAVVTTVGQAIINFLLK